MKVKTREDVPQEQMVTIRGIRKELVIGEYDQAQEIVLRVLSVPVGGAVPVHAHDFEHVWKIEQGRGFLVGEKAEHEVRAGQFVFIPGNEPHGIRNGGDVALEYLCFGTAASEKWRPTARS